MDTNTDPLLIIREAIKSHTPITYANGDESSPSLLSATHLVVSDGRKLLKSSPTRYRKPGVSTSTSPVSNPQDFFSVEAVYLAWLLRDAPGAEYIKQARENGLAVGFVSVTERKSVVDWLEGSGNDHGRIVPLVGEHSALSFTESSSISWLSVGSTTPPGTPPHAGSSIATSMRTPQKPTNTDPTPSPSKRRYVTDTQDVEIVKKIKQNEVELRDRNTVLRGVKPNVGPPFPSYICEKLKDRCMQNFSAIRNIYSEKLKKLKEASKPGAAPPTVTPAGMSDFISDTSFASLTRFRGKIAGAQSS
jgi:parafibromin